ncbi:MAG: response regulator transcription factor [Chloroflexi bacterium]|nr:response regulator transcription factor [Chloroflexota bacterium]MBU1746931.1 response regulator transcription factor [Chloroflexota bacterium]
MSQTTLRVLLVDDHEVVRVGLRALIERQPGMEVVGEAGTAQEAVTQAERLAPDVVVLDIRMPGDTGLVACRQIKVRRPGTQIIILTSYPDDEVLFDAIAAGADGYVLKQIGSDDLVRALERVGRGESLLDPAVTDRVFARMREARQRDRASAFADLTAQEMQILALVAEGQTNREIGNVLHLSEKTVRNYVSEILRKLELTSRAQAAAYAARHRIEEYL